jgi:hypothetical protein
LFTGFKYCDNFIFTRASSCLYTLTRWFFNFILNRIGKHNKEEVLEKAEKDLAAVTDQYMSRLVKELQGTDFWKLRRAYSPGVAFSTPNL